MENNNLDFNSLFLLDIKSSDLSSKKLDFPFKVSLSFKKLIEHIETTANSDDKIRKDFAQSILNELKNAPELSDPVYDSSIVKKYEGIINNMMLFVFPDAFFEKQTFAASLAFFDEVFYASPKYKELMSFTVADDGIQMNIDKLSHDFGKIISGYCVILNKFYGMNLNFEFPIVFKIPDPQTGLDRYFKCNMANEFADIIVKGNLKEFSEQDKEEIRSKLYDLDFLRKMIPPENFEIQGFLVLNVINITDTEILSAIKRDLIEKLTLSTFSGFLKLQHSLKSLLRNPDLLLGLAGSPGSSRQIFQFGNKIGNSFLMNDKCAKKLSSIKGSIYDFSFQSRKIVIIEDLEKYPKKTKVEEEILKLGIKNIFIAPLIYGDEIVGILELGSPTPGSINLVNSLKLKEVLPLFAMSVARSKDEINNKIQAIIKEKCTAIHPSLEWRFRNAALKLLKQEDEGMQAEMEEIVFHEVYPLYGLSDIRNSSLQRNDAIKNDLIDNLNLALQVINTAKKYKPLYAFDELIHKINKKIDSLKFSIDSGDEAQILSFLRNQIIPLFEHIQIYNSDLKNKIDYYNSSLDTRLGFVYKKRKEYDDSATKLSDLIANYIDDEQIKIQAMFPHYYERYKTDGVDHNIYMGASLIERGEFNKLYLKNIRLWQLMVMCEVVRKAKEYKKHLSLPLETAHLILVQDSPLSIRFRFDEKKFDVDGAYNVRYEIMKKRIDKAKIKGREERLTQPDKIAIIYSQSSELQEYSEYIEYLQTNNYLKKETEELDLEEVQGVKGLKAIRVSVNTDSNQIRDSYINNETIQEAVKKMSVN